MEDKTINIRLDELKKKMKLIQVCEDDLDINLKAKVNGLGDSSNYGELENRIQLLKMKN